MDEWIEGRPGILAGRVRAEWKASPAFSFPFRLLVALRCTRAKKQIRRSSPSPRDTACRYTVTYSTVWWGGSVLVLCRCFGLRPCLVEMQKKLKFFYQFEVLNEVYL